MPTPIPYSLKVFTPNGHELPMIGPGPFGKNESSTFAYALPGNRHWPRERGNQTLVVIFVQDPTWCPKGGLMIGYSDLPETDLIIDLMGHSIPLPRRFLPEIVWDISSPKENIYDGDLSFPAGKIPVKIMRSQAIGAHSVAFYSEFAWQGELAKQATASQVQGVYAIPLSAAGVNLIQAIQKDTADFRNIGQNPSATLFDRFATYHEEGKAQQIGIYGSPYAKKYGEEDCTVLVWSNPNGVMPKTMLTDARLDEPIGDYGPGGLAVYKPLIGDRAPFYVQTVMPNFVIASLFGESPNSVNGLSIVTASNGNLFFGCDNRNIGISDQKQLILSLGNAAGIARLPMAEVCGTCYKSTDGSCNGVSCPSQSNTLNLG